MNHPLRCRCGTLRGQVSHPEKVSRGVCCCKDWLACMSLSEPASNAHSQGGRP
jgi:hypothetical protein